MMYNGSSCGRVITPACPDYDGKRQIFNRSIQKFPFIIVYCQDEDEVREAVLYAASHELEIRVRSGGHNYEGYCIGNRKMVIDTSRMKNMHICECSQRVKIGSGISNEELYGFLSRYGYPFAGGTCPTVNASGLTQGGGWGHSARMFGLTCDYLAEAELVDAEGNYITANEHCHPDLFWALRGGGGGNFGVLTSLCYRLLPQYYNVTYVDVRYSGVDEAAALQFFRVWQEWVQNGEVRFTPNSRIFNSEKDGMGIFLRGFFYGTPEAASGAVQPFLEIKGAKAEFRYVAFSEAVRIDGAVYPDSERFRFAGRFAWGKYTDSEIISILRLIKERAAGSVYASVALYALGGRVRDMAPSQTAFFYRDADYIIGLETIWEVPEAEPENLGWFRSRYRTLHFLTMGSYINFPCLCTPDYMKAYYGDNARRLMGVKKEYDPCNLFSFAQSIKAG